jgi:hypothetical protein
VGVASHGCSTPKSRPPKPSARLIGISEKQYQIALLSARNCRFFLDERGGNGRVRRRDAILLQSLASAALPNR